MAKDAKPAEEGAEAPPKKSKKMLIIILAVVLLVVLGGGAAFMLLKKGDHAEDDEETAEETAKPARKTRKRKRTPRQFSSAWTHLRSIWFRKPAISICRWRFLWKLKMRQPSRTSRPRCRRFATT